MSEPPPQVDEADESAMTPGLAPRPQSDDPPEPDRVLRGGFLRLFVGDTISTLGTNVSALALQILLIETLRADQQGIGLVRGAQFAPYLLFGLLAGVMADRMRRRPLLIGTDLVGMAIFATIAALALSGRLTVPLLAGLVFVFGAVSCLAVAAYQSYVPRLVPKRALPAAFARLEQMSATTGAIGPLAAGALLRWVSAPVAILLDAFSYAVSAAFLVAIRTPEPTPDRGERRHLVAELREGAAWVYRHGTLRPYALWLHTWFVGRALVTTVLVYYATVELDLSPLAVGLALASAGGERRRRCGAGATAGPAFRAGAGLRHGRVGLAGLAAARGPRPPRGPGRSSCSSPRSCSTGSRRSPGRSA